MADVIVENDGATDGGLLPVEVDESDRLCSAVSSSERGYLGEQCEQCSLRCSGRDAGRERGRRDEGGKEWMDSGVGVDSRVRVCAGVCVVVVVAVVAVVVVVCVLFDEMND